MQRGNEIECYSLNERKFPFISAYCLCHMGPGQVGHSQIVLTEAPPWWQYVSETVIRVILSVPHLVTDQYNEPNRATHSEAQVKSPEFLCWRIDVETWLNMMYSSKLHLLSRSACILTRNLTWDLWKLSTGITGIKCVNTSRTAQIHLKRDLLINHYKYVQQPKCTAAKSCFVLKYYHAHMKSSQKVFICIYCMESHSSITLRHPRELMIANKLELAPYYPDGFKSTVNLF